MIARPGGEASARNFWTFERQVKWGECDPAGIVYTPRFADFVAEAHLAFFEHLFAAPSYELLSSHRLALPAKALSLEFKRPLRPGALFIIEVSVADIRTRTYDLHMVARDAGGDDAFTAKFTLICLDTEIQKAVPLPDFLRDRLVAFRGKLAPPSDGVAL
jgi:YbgC/YbaW family acyl-CoA thioester hydrolase